MIFAVDGGGTTFKTCLVDDSGGGSLGDIESFPLKWKEGIGPLRESLNGIFQRRAAEAKAKGRPIRAIGVGCRGIIDSERTTLVDDSGIMNFFTGHSFRELVETDLPLGAENDAVAATLGENRYGCGKTMKHFILLTLGTGIGGGIIINNQIYKGHTGMAGHLGHFPVSPEGIACGCGNVGCVECEFSVRAFGPRIEALNASRAGGAKVKDVKDLFERAKRGESEPLAILKRGVFYLGRTISGYANALDPEKCILSGGIADAGDFLMQMLCDELRPYLWLKKPETFLEFSKLGSQMGLYGAGAVGAMVLERGAATRS